MQRDAKAAISRRSFLKEGGCVPPVTTQKATARYGNESLHDPAPLAGNENPQDCMDCHSMHHLAVREKVYGMPGRALEIGCKLGEEKNCMGPFTNDKQ